MREMLAEMKSAHKKTKQTAYRTFPELVAAYEAAIASLASVVKHTDGNDLGVGHPIEYFYAHLHRLDLPRRAEFVREMRRSYSAWIEEQELAAEERAARGPDASWNLDRGPSEKKDTPPDVDPPPKRPRRK